MKSNSEKPKKWIVFFLKARLLTEFKETLDIQQQKNITEVDFYFLFLQYHSDVWLPQLFGESYILLFNKDAQLIKKDNC